MGTGAVRRRLGDRRARRAASRTLTVHGHRDSGDADDATLVRAVVHARLLGTAAADPGRPGGGRQPGRPVLRGAQLPAAPPVPHGRPPLGAVDGDVLTARELLAQGADVLARTRVRTTGQVGVTAHS